MTTQCQSIRSKAAPGDQCPNRAGEGGEWCGKHRKTQTRWLSQAKVDEIVHAVDATRIDLTLEDAAQRIFTTWRRYLAAKAGPLLWFRNESNNPADFFSSDPVTEIPLRDVVSFVDGGKGYIMDIKSAVSLVDHAVKDGQPPLNPFNRAPLPALFLRRVAARQKETTTWAPLDPTTPEQAIALTTTDAFRAIEDLGYYTAPHWFLDLRRIELQRLYIEMADIWFHRVGLTIADHHRISPPNAAFRPFESSVRDVMTHSQTQMRRILLNTFRALTTQAPARGDRQTGVLYVLGALSLVSAGAKAAYPWMWEMFAPGVARIVGGMQIVVAHPAVLNY
jgi:hypothetical protein